MAGAASDIRYLQIVHALAYGDTVVAGADVEAGEHDVVGSADVDAVGVGAVGGRRYPEATDGDGRALLEADVEALAIDESKVSDRCVAHHQQPHGLHVGERIASACDPRFVAT